MRNLLNLITLSLILSSPLYAQDSLVTVSKNRYTQVEFGVGYLNTNVKSINSSLSSFGLKPISENYVNLSIASSFFLNRFLLRSEVNFFVPNYVDQPNQMTSRFGGHSFGMGVGYAVVKAPRLRVYPYIGLNSFVNRLELTDNTPVSNMAGVINTPHRSSSIYFSNASLDVGVQIDRLIFLKNRKWDCPQNQRFMAIGLRTGYYIGTNDIRGKYNGGNQTVSDVPTYSLKGPYVKVTIGLGTKLRDLKWKK